MKILHFLYLPSHCWLTLVYAGAPMAIINTENIRSTIWIALKRLDLNGWYNCFIIICPNYIKNITIK